MLDPNLIADQPDVVRAHLARRHADDGMHADLERIVALSERRKELISERDHLRAERNSLSKEIGALYKAGRRDEAEAMKDKVSHGNARTKIIEEELDTVEQEVEEASNKVDEPAQLDASDDDDPVTERAVTEKSKAKEKAEA